jgi:hypothetical protein
MLDASIGLPYIGGTSAAAAAAAAAVHGIVSLQSCNHAQCAPCQQLASKYLFLGL